VSNHLEINPDSIVEQLAFQYLIVYECKKATNVSVCRVECVDNLRLELYEVFRIDLVLYVEYSNEYFSLFHNILIEHQVNDLHVCF